MNYLYFCLSFLFCNITLCCTFLFCTRVLYVQKVDKLDPINAIKTPKKITALKTIKREEMINQLLERG